MNASQKQALRRHNPDLTHDLDLTADLVAKFIHYGLFNEDMIDEIKAERTRKDRIQKILLTLPRRGPRAFDLFVHAIHEDFPWLADDLKKTHHKIASKTEPRTLELKKQVDIYVHEHFGNSKRLCEEDKKDMRKFLYKHLKSKDTGQLNDSGHFTGFNAGHRGSIDSNFSDHMVTGENENSNEQGIGNKLLKKIFSIFGKKSDNANNCDALDGMDDVDGCIHGGDHDAEVTIEMIEQRANELNDKVDSLQNEMNECYTVLGIENRNQPLHEILEKFTEDRKIEHAHFQKLQDKMKNLERQRQNLEQELQSKENELHETMNELADSQHINEKTQALMNELKEKNERLEQLHVKHVEKQQTLIALKHMVNDLVPNKRLQSVHPVLESQRNPLCDESSKSVVLPKLSPVHVRRQRQSNYKEYHDNEEEYHHVLPRVRASHHGLPWK